MRNVFVFTIDQIASRSKPDAVPALLAKVADLPAVIPFSRTVGDEVQGVLDNPAAAVEVLRRVLPDKNWHIGIGIGPLKPEERKLHRSAEGTSATFALGREAVESAKKKPGRAQVAVRSARSHSSAGDTAQANSDVAHLEALLDLWVAVVGQRTSSQLEVIAAADHYPNATQTELAAILGMTQQGVAKSLANSLWRQEHAILPLVEHLLAASAAVRCSRR